MINALHENRHYVLRGVNAQANLLGSKFCREIRYLFIYLFIIEKLRSRVRLLKEPLKHAPSKSPENEIAERDLRNAASDEFRGK